MSWGSGIGSEGAEGQGNGFQSPRADRRGDTVEDDVVGKHWVPSMAKVSEILAATSVVAALAAQFLDTHRVWERA